MGAQRLVQLGVVGSLLLLPALAGAQAVTGTIAGVVRDTSGAVMPGVTVEASSPALIEKVRSVTTDGQGLYRIVDLRPGVYTVTFTLPGFSTLRREGVELTSSFTATVNADLRVGALEESITVSGEAPVVDTQNVRQQSTFARSTLDAIPTTKRLGQYATIIPGATYANATFQDVGGTQGEGGQFAVHGQRAGDISQNFEGISSNQQAGGVYSFNSQTFQEVVVETGGTSAEAVTGGVQLNIIAKDGGNTLSGSFSTALSGPDLQADNLTDELVERGLKTSQSIRKSYDTGGALGGPIVRDKLWFFTAHRWWGASRYIQGSYFNAAQGTLFYEPDLDRVSHNNEYFKDSSLRLTWQAAPKHKVVFSYSIQDNCSCPFGLTGVGGVNAVKPAPESRAPHVYNPQYLPVVSWTFPATNRLLIESAASVQILNEDSRRQEYVSVNDIRVTDQGLNIVYGSDANNNTWSGSYTRRFVTQYNSRAAVSYVTGTHSIKAGYAYKRYNLGRPGWYNDPHQINHARSYTFRNRVPVSVTIWNVPFEVIENTTNFGVFAQDQWTMRKLTLNLGLRYDSMNGAAPDQSLPAGIFVPARNFAAVKDVPNWKNLNPRLGATYDLFGNGRTAIKTSLGRYVPLATATVGNPASQQAQSATRNWDDSFFGPGDPRTGNYVPDCDLANPALNGECAARSDTTFGQVRAGNTRRADDARTGYNLQGYNWQGSVAVQQEIMPGMALNVGYFRTWYGAFLATDNQLWVPSDFGEYCITAPTDSRLGEFSGRQYCDLYDISPAKFGQTDNLVTQAEHYGKQTEVYNGVDVTLSWRFRQGGQFAGGLSVGRTATDSCFTIDSPQNERPDFCADTPPWSAGTQVKFLVVYPLPWALQTSAIYQNIPGIPITAVYPATNAEIAPTLGRNLGACGTRPTCTSTVNVDLIPPNTMFEDRLQQVDLRFSRLFQAGRTRIRANMDIANVFNASNVISVNQGYGSQWMVPYEIMGGRLFKFSGTFDF
jgi:hypothetical protein